MARLLSVNVGLPRDISWQGRTVHTGIWKDPVRGRCRARRLNLEGDGQGDLAGHGGEHRAVFVYQIESYRHWEEQLRRPDLVYGQFGENFTVDGLPDDAVCIGDRYRIGGALLEVTQPRVTCYRVGIRMNEPRMPALLTGSGRPGFYFRVLQEGDVGAGDEIAKVGQEDEPMTVAEINALLYSPAHPRDRLERARRIAALSPGWRTSFETLLGTVTGASAALAPAAAQPAAPGLRQLAVTAVEAESADVLSFTLESSDGQPLTAAMPGQYVIVRLVPPEGGPPLYRSYSLSGPPSTQRHRISVKIEPAGVAGAYLKGHLHAGDALDVSAPRGSFVLQPGERPVVLISAGIGATPVLAMLHALASTRAGRQVLWLHQARDGEHHPFAAEVRQLLRALPHGRGCVCYSRPRPRDTGFDVAGRLSRSLLEQAGVPREADAYLCGPGRFMDDMRDMVAGLGIAPQRTHVERFGGGESLTPGVVAGRATRVPHPLMGDTDTGPRVSFARSGVAARFRTAAHASILELAEACDVPVRWACRTGVCHSCECGLVSGVVRYQPKPLERPAAGNVLVCCSQPDGDVVVDL
jgi:ferredoxin-NADP reductase/MOSC domain-containing protein YiiM